MPELNSNPILEQALYLSEEMNWSIIPVGKDKKPTISWKKYQSKKASAEQLKKWFKNPETNLGVVTGNVSNLFVVDIDPRHGGTDTDFVDIDTVKSKTGGGGTHIFFKYEDGLQNQASVRSGIDTRGEGGYVVLPPSLHTSGKRYEWATSPKDAQIVPIPDFVKDWLRETKEKTTNKEKTFDKDLLDGVGEGQRNEVATRVVGKLLKRFPEEEWESEAWPLLVGWNLKNNPPMGESELKNIFDSIVKAEKSKEVGDEGNPKRSVADKIVDLALELGVELYLDQTGEPHVTFPEKPIVGFPVRGSIFRRWVSAKYWQEYNKGFSGESFQQAVGSIEGKAFHENKNKNLHNRIARIANTIYYDLGNDINVVKITGDGWEITNNCPEKFRRFNHQIPQIKPLTGGDVSEVLKYLNLKSETDRLLFVTYLLTAFIPDIPRVVLIHIGDQGAAKSTGLRIVRSLIDPSISELLSPPTDINELAQASNHHFCLYLDNLSYLRDELSDALCRLATGIGFTKRKLFTNDEDILFTQKVAIGITGINLVATRPDLLDRCLILTFERIPEERRIDEETFWKNFNDEKPYILGSIFDKLSQILKIIPNFKLSKQPRMADYAKYAAVAAMALNKSPEEFLNVFSKNIERQNQAAIDSSPTAQVILQFMKDKDGWQGLSSVLHKELKKIAEEINLEIGGSDGFPKSSNWLWKKIMSIRPNLLSLGIKASKVETASGSEISITKSSEDSKNTAIASIPANPSLKSDGSIDGSNTVSNLHTAITSEANMASVAPVAVNQDILEEANKIFKEDDIVETEVKDL